MMFRRSAVLALCISLVPACHRAPQVEPEIGEAPDVTITIRVVNHAQLDATIYVTHDGVRERLGTVSAAAAASFALRPRMLGSGEFVLTADPLGSRRTASSERLIVALGTLFTWTLESDFEHNSVIVQE